MSEVHGRLEFTERAFAQDADQAMAGDIVRALIELVTNADDAYGEADGPVVVDVVENEGEPTRVSVRDLATGLTPEELATCFGILGGVNRKFVEGVPNRGLLGRGAKDTATFGRTVFETIKDGTYGRFELRRDTTTVLHSEKATDEQHADLEIPAGGSGLVATIHVEEPGIAIPRPHRLGDRLADHVQLRRLNRERQVVLRWSRDGHPSPSQVVQWTVPPGEVLVDTEIEIDGYDATAALTLVRMPTPADGGLNPYSRHGIEIHGEKAAYDNTFFGEGSPETRWIRGILHCPHIETLIRAFDDDEGRDEKNPTRLLRRDRDGLVTDHPFTRALGAAVLTVLAPILEELKPKRTAVGGGDRLREDLDAAGRALARLLKDDLERIDEDEPHRGGTGPTVANPIVVIPPRLKVAPDSDRTLTVLVQDPALGDGALTASSNRAEHVEVVELTELRPHDVLAETSIANVRIRTGTLGSASVVVAIPDGPSATCAISVQEVVPPEVVPPDELEWKNQSMSVTVGKTRSVRLRAPATLAPGGRLACKITVDGNAVSLRDDQVELALVDDGWLEGTCTLTGETVNESVAITATGGSREAVGRVRVTRPSGFDGLLPEITILDEKRASLRGQMEEVDTGFVIEVYGRHPGLAEILGPRGDDGTYRHEQDRHVRVALAEVVASVIADWLVLREAQKYPQDFPDALAAINQRSQNLARYLVVLQRAIAGEEPQVAG